MIRVGILTSNFHELRAKGIARHVGLPADKGKAMFLGNALQRIADYLFDAAAVDHQRAFFYLMGVLGDVFHRSLRIEGNNEHIAAGKGILAELLGDDFCHLCLEDDARIQVQAKYSVIRMFRDGLCHGAANQPQADNADFHAATSQVFCLRWAKFPEPFSLFRRMRAARGIEARRKARGQGRYVPLS